MNPSNEAALSALRTVIAMLGVLVVAMGWSSNEKVQTILRVLNEVVPPLLGALMVLGPIAWGMIDKFRARNKIVNGVNAGIALANADVGAPGATPPVSKEMVPGVIKQYGEKTP